MTNLPSADDEPVCPSVGALEIPGGWTEREVVVGECRWWLRVPRQPDAFLAQLTEDAVAHVADPYWAAIWNAAPQLAERVLRHRWQAGAPALELGCGVGLVGLSALAAGMSVTFSDYIRPAVALAVENAHRNGFADATGYCLDWRSPQAGETYPLILASDVLYERDLHAPLVNTLDCLLATDGVCWIGDPRRMAADDFAQLARRHGFDVAIERDTGGATQAGQPATFQLLTVRRAAP